MSLESKTENSALHNQTTIRFDHFCFETIDKTGIILNYSCLTPLLKTYTCKDVIDKIVAFVAVHMQVRTVKQFTIHLFCSGMLMRDMTTHRTFMIKFAQMFKSIYPNELATCYVYGASTVFSSIYELFKSILPKRSRDKIIIVSAKNTSNIKI